MKDILLHLRKLDWVLIISALFLAGFGLLSIYSSSAGGDFSNFRKQIIFIAIGFLSMMIFSFLDWRIFRDNSYLILALYFLCLILLAGLFYFVQPIRDVKSWYKIGQFSLDPIELAKIALAILLAKYFSMRHVEMYRFYHIILSGLYVMIPALLVFFQPNLGSVMVLVLLWMGILIISGIKTRHFLILCFAGFLILAFSWQFLLKDYQKDRITSFINPQFDPKGISWNVKQSKIAIGSGGILGKGIDKGSQVQYGFLPEPQTDFIFSAIAEETGLIGVIALLSLFSLLVWRVLKVALTASSNFSRLFSAGIATILISQFFINIGMNLGLLPIIGLSLPLVSYGGSGLIFVFIGLGILQSIIIRK